MAQGDVTAAPGETMDKAGDGIVGVAGRLQQQASRPFERGHPDDRLNRAIKSGVMMPPRFSIESLSYSYPSTQP